MNDKNLFTNYQNIVLNIMKDKNDAKRILNEISQVLIIYLNYLADNNQEIDSEILNLLNGKDMDKIVNILSIIEEEQAKLEYNINYKLWIDALFARIILGG